ncbi:MAG: hypothetical protein KIT83_03590 [Bryobacterales bacterium]|nr:hypothetical protein [Bryobacterales bacterium]
MRTDNHVALSTHPIGASPPFHPGAAGSAFPAITWPDLVDARQAIRV